MSEPGWTLDALSGFCAAEVPPEHAVAVSATTAAPTSRNLCEWFFMRDNSFVNSWNQDRPAAHGTGGQVVERLLEGRQGIPLGVQADLVPSRQDHQLGPVSYTHLRAHETRHDLVC